MMEGSTLSLISVNCRSTRDKGARLCELFRRRQCDFLLLQETRIRDEYEGNKLVGDMQLRHGWFSYTSGQNNYLEGWGTAILQTSDRWTVTGVERLGGRATAVTITDKTETLVLVTVYAPAVAQERKKFYKKLSEFLEQFDKEIILMGDFNVTLEDRDIFGTWVGEIQHGREELKQLIETSKLRDGYRVQFPLGDEFSFNHQAHDRRSRIDRVYIGQNRQINKHKFLDETVTTKMTDHKAVYVQLGEKIMQRRMSPHWKLNNSVLENDEYVRTVKEEIIQAYTLYPPHNSAKLNWEGLKETVKNFTKIFCKDLQKKRREREGELRLILELAEKGSYLDQPQIVQYKEELESLKNYRYQGALIRSRVDYTEEPSKEFLAMESLVQSKKTIEGVQNKTGEFVTGNRQIGEAFLDFYTELYDVEQTDSSVQDEFLNYARTLDEAQRAELDNDISDLEITKAVNSFKSNKAPGPDGLTAAFYKKFVGDLLPLFRAVIEESWNEGELPASMNLSYITLLPKAENCTQTSQYRPISLINVDYKIISKVHTQRLSKHIGTLIHPDQAAVCKGRTIQDLNHLLRDVIAYAKNSNIHACVLSLDQIKAFDRVSHSYLFKLLDRSNFGPVFQKWIRIFYQNPESKILINHTLTGAFKIKRSIRQGDSISPILYVLTLEPLLQKIRLNPRIQGIMLPGGRELKQLAFVDDTNFFPKTHESIKLIMEEFNKFGKASGSKVNEQKTQLMPLGSWKPALPDPHESARVNVVKVFGIHYTNSINQIPRDQWQTLVKKIEDIVKVYFYRSTTIFGRAIIMNTLGFSKINYLIASLDVPGDIKKEIQKTVREFLLKGTVYNVSQETLILAKLDGGVGVQDLEARQDTERYKYIKQIIENPTAYPFGTYYLGFHLRQHLQFDNATPHFDTFTRHPPEFYQNCINIIRKHPTLFTTLPDTKKAYTYFIAKRQARTLHKKALFSRIKHSTTHGILDFTDTFKHLHTKDFPNTEKQITWRILYHNTPTKEGAAVGRGRIVSCAICKEPVQETQEHIYWTCKGAYDCIQALRIFLNAPNRTKLSYKHTHKTVFLNLLDPMPQQKSNLRIKLIVVSIYRYIIWTTRLLCWFENRSFTADQIFCRYMALIRYRLGRLGLWEEFQRMAG